MAKKIRLTQEEEVIKILSREGFREVSPEELSQEPYKTLVKLPECFDAASHGKSKLRKVA